MWVVERWTMENVNREGDKHNERWSSLEERNRNDKLKILEEIPESRRKMAQVEPGERKGYWRSML